MRDLRDHGCVGQKGELAADVSLEEFAEICREGGAPLLQARVIDAKRAGLPHDECRYRYQQAVRQTGDGRTARQWVEAKPPVLAIRDPSTRLGGVLQVLELLSRCGVLALDHLSQFVGWYFSCYVREVRLR
jgi:hypothetical protein